MKIAVIGTGYVGLVQGTCLADSGNHVVCMDIDEAKIGALKQGKIPIYEPALEELVRHNAKEGRLSFTTSLKTALDHAGILFLCLPTPEGMDGGADISRLEEVSTQIAELIGDEKFLVVSKSTAPVGTVDRLQEIFRQRGKSNVIVVSNPEFLKEGAAVRDAMKPDRVVIGTDDEHAREILRDLYEPFTRTGNPILFMDPRSAELTKYAANALLATKITFMNELANLCDAVGADVSLVRKGVGTDPRIGNQFLFPGPGYGGSCFPKDVKALEQLGKSAGVELKIVQAVDVANEKQKTILFGKISKHFGGALKGKAIAVWGLSFKPNTDDVRESPAFALIDQLLEAGAAVRAHDPVAIGNTKKKYADSIKYSDEEYETLNGADALAIVTEWNVFRRPDFERMKKLLKNPVIFDGRNIYEPSKMKEMGFTYFGIGRGGE